MSVIIDTIAKVRDEVSEVYWAAREKFGPLVPTPQVVGSGLAGLAVLGIQRWLPSLGIPENIVTAVVITAVAWLIGPERPVEVTIKLAPPELAEPQSIGHGSSLPAVPGEFVGPEDDDTGPIG